MLEKTVSPSNPFGRASDKLPLPSRTPHFVWGAFSFAPAPKRVSFLSMIPNRVLDTPYACRALSTFCRSCRGGTFYSVGDFFSLFDMQGGEAYTSRKCTAMYC